MSTAYFACFADAELEAALSTIDTGRPAKALPGLNTRATERLLFCSEPNYWMQGCVLAYFAGL